MLLLRTASFLLWSSGRMPFLETASQCTKAGFSFCPVLEAVGGGWSDALLHGSRVKADGLAPLMAPMRISCERKYGWEPGTTAVLWFSADFLSVCWCVSWFPWLVCLPPGFLCLLVMLLRIRGFLWGIQHSISLCDISCFFFQFSEFTSGQDALPTVLNSGFVHTLPKEQASTSKTDSFFSGVMTPTLLPVRPGLHSTDVGLF